MKSKTAMTGRERVQRAFERREQDRVPRNDTYWPGTIRKWKAAGAVESAEDALVRLGNDFRKMQSIYWPHPFPGRHEVVKQDEETITFTDGWGQTVRQFKAKDSTPEHVGWECDSREVWHERFRSRIVDQPVRIDIELAKTNYALGQTEQAFTCLSGIEPFEILRKLLGDVTSLMAMVEDPEWIVDICNVTTDNSIRNYDALWESGVQPDCLWVYGDMAYNHATMCSPAMYRDLIWPSHCRLAEWAHRRGMRFIYHTDGDVNGVMDLYCDAGFDCLQPLECKANMDIRRLIPLYGERMVFFGNVDVMELIDNDLDRIETEVRTKLEAGKESLGYIYHVDHSVPPQVEWESYLALIGFLDRYGNYHEPAGL